jgi:hypothetical protein
MCALLTRPLTLRNVDVPYHTADKIDCAVGAQRIPEHVPGDSKQYRHDRQRIFNFFRNFTPKNPEKILTEFVK